ncbi:hypothetical protein FNV43_RR20771 [Rhamnella rubrinervis]|uniref:Dirigent protein n=1 Tax=Rhamnella rubrinervis TaxID=2594499 RepID=A0A8K0E222_9ROSA|nr:hypothetical protein FNV43_RR20771 [Rhamnella rubrinervis]
MATQTLLSFSLSKPTSFFPLLLSAAMALPRKLRAKCHSRTSFGKVIKLHGFGPNRSHGRDGSGDGQPAYGKARAELDADPTCSRYIRHGLEYDEFSLLTSVTYSFTSGRLNGSSLSVVGRNPVMSGVREMLVVGGTGLFRPDRGYCFAWTYSMEQMDAAIGYTLLHY